ncbi:MAG: adenosine deaminase, partial [Deltaproteobacteria bacterium]|nr:adenosine deaminase [Deltaproteobacteria bacterium]
GVRAGLICIVSRGYPLEDARATIEFACANRQHFIGVDLAGPEDGYPCRNYQDVFKPALAAGMPITIHAGEACGPENVWEAIDLLGARRIGHGINSIRDKELMRRLAKDGILLETCPTSNYITRSVAEWDQHPLPRFLEAGIPVSISTDDPGIFGVPLAEEYARCKSFLMMSDADLRKIDEYAAQHSFLSK